MNSNDFFSNTTPTPLTHLTTIEGKQLYLKHDYRNHPTIQGNKWRKLKYNLLAAQQYGQTLVSFGGAYSNHIAALASAGKAFNLPTVGIIRGEELIDKSRWGHTLHAAHDNGMTLHFVSRDAYRAKAQHPDIAKIIQHTSNAQLIPEGGSNALAVKGCKEIINEIKIQLPKTDAIFTACGTGGTLAGLIDGVAEQTLHCQLHGIAILKGATFLSADIQRLSQHQAHVDWQLHQDYHFGGYAKKSSALIRFITDFSTTYHIPLDAIYTAKLAYAVFDLAQRSNGSVSENWVIYHSGGLQNNTR